MGLEVVRVVQDIRDHNAGGTLLDWSELSGRFRLELVMESLAKSSWRGGVVGRARSRQVRAGTFKLQHPRSLHTSSRGDKERQDSLHRSLYPTSRMRLPFENISSVGGVAERRRVWC